MLKFIRGKGHQPSAERQKLQRELFAFRKTVQHGFPNKPTCLAWDPILRLMAVGTTSGAIKVLGQPGVEFYGHLSSTDTAITRLLFIPNEGRLVSLSDDNTLHLWEINETMMEETKSVVLEGKLKKISALCLESSGQYLLLGTEGGNIYLLNVATFVMSENIIYQDVVMQNVPEDYKINPGAVEGIAEQPGHPDRVLIGYNRGLIVLWDRKSQKAHQTFVSNQQLESLSWHNSGEQFLSSHNDGSYTTWDVGSSEPKGEPTTPYGPFPCKSITKLLWRPTNKDSYLFFAGGLPRASFSDRHTITVQSSVKQVAFDFTSKVVDFFTIQSEENEKDCTALIVLAEEELVGIDLTSDNWNMLALPYLVSLHASAVTCSAYISDVPQNLYNNIVAAGTTQTKGIYSDADWPINGGIVKNKDLSPKCELLLTGHEDGSVRFWDAGGVALKPLYKFTSATVLCGEDDGPPPSGEDEEDEWPPFRKVGTFDPYSDDPRLAVKKISLCPDTGTLAVAGTAGHVIVAKIGLTTISKEVQVTVMNIVSERDKFVWKGHEKLTLRGDKDAIEIPPGFQPSSLLQLHPPAAVTALALQSNWGLVAVGTAHGLAVFDYIRNSPVTIKCTLNPHDLSGIGEPPISRRKSFKKSLRESFRRLRKGRSTRRPEKRNVQTPPDKKRDSAESPSLSRGGATPTSPAEAKPVERAVEARPVDDALGSMVRCLTFVRTYIISVQNTTPTLWAGTNNGTVYVFTISIPASSKRIEENVNCQLGKEIQLKHRAPVIAVSVIDGAVNAVEQETKPSDTIPPHKVVICSEEQIKIFTLPSLKPLCKLKLTASEGARVRRIALSNFTAHNHHETCLLCLTNLGETIVLSLPELRRQIIAAVIRREDINGISSLTFTKHGEALYMHSSSEIQRVTVSATSLTVATCHLDLPPSARAPIVAQTSESESSDSSSESSSSSSSSESDEEEEKEESLQPVEVVKENGIGEEESNHVGSGHDLSSVGDITIDSVKDHLINSSNEESRVITTELVKNETTKMETTRESVTVKTTVITTNETTLITPPSENT
uniref:Uncharacterized protein n=1 Tax=Clastoptera arizonana TaxID=38151 RepID=A0A1B6CIZ4_9HEMI